MNSDDVPCGPWRRRSRKRVYENPWIAVDHDEVITPGGSDGIYGVVHFKTRAIGIVPLDEADNTWLVRQFRYTLNAYSWEIPEGGGALNEPALEAARRELREETGLFGGHWEHLLQLHLSNSVTDEGCDVFLATGLQQGEQALEDTEDIEVKKLPLREAVDMALRGEITDAISVAALLAVARRLQRSELPPQ